MLSRTISFGIHGIDASIIEIEVDIISGLPNFTIVGLPDSTIRESKDRIRSALENSGFAFPPKNFIVNLAPAGFKKQGANFDLPIAISILNATGQIDSGETIIPMVGELSLDGRVKAVKGVISMVITLFRLGYRSVIVPHENRFEAAAIDGIDVYPVKTIDDASKALTGHAEPIRSIYKTGTKQKTMPDFADVRGQETAKRAIEIAAAGHHNILLYGSPGSGKTMLARRIPSILPSLLRDQAIETTMIHSVDGALPQNRGLITDPPFRSPHHTASDAALVGGGMVPTVGEVSLSHNGVLFLDEFVEFKNNVIQALRQPLEDNEVTVSRASGTYRFPADFMLAAASNPCRCGYLFDDEIRCRCYPHSVKNYFNKISGPIMDRIDIEVLVNRVPYRDLFCTSSMESSDSIRERVLKAREIQTNRFAKSKTHYNSRMSQDEIREHCTIDNDTGIILEVAVKRINITARSYFKILKVSRTIADLEGSVNIKKRHVLEALSYKNLQRNYDV